MDTEPPSPAILLLLTPVFLVASFTGLSFGILSIIILLICSAMISGAEVAYFSLSPADVHLLASEDSPTSKRILQLRERSRILLATILISNNFVNIAIVILSDYLIGNIFSEETFMHWGTILKSFTLFQGISVLTLATSTNFLLTVVGATVLLVLFGEIAPKLYANVNNIQMAKTMSRPLIVLNTIFYPISKVLVNWTNRFESKLSQDTSRSKSRKDDLDKAIELTVSHEQNSEKEIDILKSIVKFGDVNVKQIMRSRMDVVAIDIVSDFSEVMKIVKDSGYSRIPVYEEDFDNIKGILYAKDLLLYLAEVDTFKWNELVRKDVKYVPEAKKINELLTEFQQERTHMAIVVDEFGGSGGLVTLEDIMEEVIGDIRDEFDEEVEIEFEKLDDFNYVFEGKTLLNDLCRAIGISTDTFGDVKGGADSVAGLILELLGKIPRKNLEIKYKEYRFKILSVSIKRIEKVQITLPHESKN